MGIPFGGLSLQENCHYPLRPSVGMLSGTSHKLNYGEAERLANCRSAYLPTDIEFYN